MTKVEVRMFAELSKEDDDGDYRMVNDDAHWSIVESACAWNVNKTVDQWRSDVDDIEYRERPRGGWIVTSRFLIREYLRAKAVAELWETAT
jgi:hypothetical protein